MSRKWLDKKNATTFEVVHRSHEDALYHDEDAPSAVLVKSENLNDKGQKQARKDKWITGARLREFSAKDARNNEGEAALYGITYDDSHYDYMQHLRPIGEHEDAVFVANSGKTENSARANKKGEMQFKDDVESQLPAEVLPQESHRYDYQDQQGIQDSISGLQPDMDPRLREVLEALEDEEYYEDGDEVDDLFGELTTNAQQVDKDTWEADQPEIDVRALERKEDEQDWEYEFRKFKLDQKTAPKAADSDVDSSDFGSDFAGSEGLDTVGELPTTKQPRKKKIGARTDLTGFSMSSSANFRNKGLELLDDRFDQVEAQYAQDEESSEEEEFDMAKERPDLESIMDDFLEKEVVFGKKLYKRR